MSERKLVKESHSADDDHSRLPSSLCPFVGPLLLPVFIYLLSDGELR